MLFAALGESADGDYFWRSSEIGVFRCPGTQKWSVQWLDSKGRAKCETADSGAKCTVMIPLLFLNPQWVRGNPVPAILISVIFICLGMALMDWWRRRYKIAHT